jgi:hypothetical protein
MVSVGKLRKVKLRDVWEHEPNDFTPWLANSSLSCPERSTELRPFARI